MTFYHHFQKVQNTKNSLLTTILPATNRQASTTKTITWHNDFILLFIKVWNQAFEKSLLVQLLNTVKLLIYQPNSLTKSYMCKGYEKTKLIITYLF